MLSPRIFFASEISVIYFNLLFFMILGCQFTCISPNSIGFLSPMPEDLDVNTFYDIRREEFEALHCIYPELKIDKDFTVCTIDIPIHLETPLTLRFQNKETSICNLPALHCRIELPYGYPELDPPIVLFENINSWLDGKNVNRIYSELYKIWEGFKDAVIYSYLDYVRSESRFAFHLYLHGELVVSNEEDFRLLQYENYREKQRIFEQGTYTCDICQMEKKGDECSQFPYCAHVFCNICLKDYFTHIIERGEIENVHCPSFTCTKERNKAIIELTRKAEEGKIADFKEFDDEFFKLPVSPDLMRRFLLGETKEELIQRYMSLYEQTSMERYAKFFPNRVANCPRSFCATTFIKKDPDNKLAICPGCNFAFCSQCLHSWHGDINSCSIYKKKIPEDIILKWIDNSGQTPNKQTSEERETCSNIIYKYGKKIIELAASEYIAQVQFEELVKSGDADITQCPSCSTYIQRSDGCNKMTCSKCLVFFCNLCGDRLNRNDPYEHYNNPLNRCFGKLFQGMVPEEDG